MTIGSLTLDPVFDAETLSYEVATTNATNKVTAITNDLSATIEIDHDGDVVANGGTATWTAGENILTITVTDGTAETVYVVTVTKS